MSVLIEAKDGRQLTVIKTVTAHDELFFCIVKSLCSLETSENKEAITLIYDSLHGLKAEFVKSDINSVDEINHVMCCKFLVELKKEAIEKIALVVQVEKLVIETWNKTVANWNGVA